MSIQLKVPSLGESVTQATVGAWLKKEGDAVAADEPRVEVESEKATVALPAPAAGVLRKVLKGTGESVGIGEVIGELDEGAAAAKGGNGATRTAAAVATTAAPTPTATPTSPPTSTATSPPTATSTPTSTPTPTP